MALSEGKRASFRLSRVEYEAQASETIAIGSIWQRGDQNIFTYIKMSYLLRKPRREKSWIE